MPADMNDDLFAEQPYGKVALRKLNATQPVSENFRLFSAGWLGDNPKEFEVMEVKGAEFRHAKTGPNKGKLTVLIKGTTRTTYVTKAEMAAEEAASKQPAEAAS